MTHMQLREYYVSESLLLLDGLERAGTGDARTAIAELRRCARGIRGLARLANEEHVVRAASALELAARSLDATQPPPSFEQRVRESASDLRALVQAEAPDDDLEARAAAIVSRWAEAAPAETPVATESEPATQDDDEFHAFVAREASGVADVLDRAIDSFVETPANREWLGAILRRQRVLLGAARLDEVPTVAETLRAVEAMAELIVRLNVPIKSEWLDVFRSAREVLRTSATSLQHGTPPPFTPALSRLRTLRNELWDRYGEKAAATPELAPGPVAGMAASAAPEPAYISTSSPLQRAAALRAEIEQAIGGNARAREALEALHAMLVEALQ